MTPQRKSHRQRQKDESLNSSPATPVVDKCRTFKAVELTKVPFNGLKKFTIQLPSIPPQSKSPSATACSSSSSSKSEAGNISKLRRLSVNLPRLDDSLARRLLSKGGKKVLFSADLVEDRSKKNDNIRPSSSRRSDDGDDVIGGGGRGRGKSRPSLKKNSDTAPPPAKETIVEASTTNSRGLPVRKAAEANAALKLSSREIYKPLKKLTNLKVQRKWKKPKQRRKHWRRRRMADKSVESAGAAAAAEGTMEEVVEVVIEDVFSDTDSDVDSAAAYLPPPPKKDTRTRKVALEDYHTAINRYLREAKSHLQTLSTHYVCEVCNHHYRLLESMREHVRGHFRN